MTAPDVLDLRGVAARLGVRYGWLQKNWRTTPGFPQPFLGAGPGERPRWWLGAIEAFKSGRRFLPAEAAPVAPSAVYPVANDPAPLRPSPDVAALIAAAGG